jgi:hypothetical protein
MYRRGERHSDTDDGIGVVSGDLLDDHLALNSAQSSALIRGWDG